MSCVIEKCIDENTKHEGDITCVIYFNGHVYSGGADGKIKIWDKNLQLEKVLNCHEAYIYALTITPEGKLYSSSCDGRIKFTVDPLKSESDNIKDLLRCDDEIQCLQYQDNCLYSGDDKGVVTKWQDDKIIFKYNLIEEVKSLAIEQNRIYTVRNLDTVVTEMMTGESGKFTTKATIPGRAPLCLIGPQLDGIKSYLSFTTRNGLGLTLVSNRIGDNFRNIWTKEDCHEMIINAICGTEKSLYSAGWDGKIKNWIEIDKSPKNTCEAIIGSSINTICNGDDGVVYVGSSDGMLRKIKFS